jgi:hypothetical protein|tara:strand:- start:1566 stop:2177 length:612 start_codon:yes stop_codon:yes gene_type:complete
MKLVELYGYSCSGKSYKANEIRNKENLDIQFSNISKKNRFLRLLIKIYYISFIRLDDFKFIINIHKEFKFLNLEYKFKNFISFMFLIGFMRNKMKTNKSLVIDHGIFQCLFSCFIFSIKKQINCENISKNLINFFSRVPINFDYQIICMQTDIETIRSRLKENKKNFQFLFLENNEEKIKETYINLKKISKLIKCRNISFKDI